MGNLRNLLMGRPLPKPREDDDDNAHANAGGGSGGERSIDPNAIEAAAEADRNAAVADATKKATEAANTRWNTVMTSEAGVANPKGAAKLLIAAGGAMSAQEVIDTLGDVSAADPKAQKAASEAAAADTLQADRTALANDKTANPDTGPGAGGGEGDDAEANARKARRQQRVQGNNQRMQRGGRDNRSVRGGRDRD